MELKTLGIRLNVPDRPFQTPWRIIVPANSPKHHGIHASWHTSLKNHALWMERHGTKVEFSPWNYEHGPEMTELWVNEFRVGIDFTDLAQLSYWASAYNFVLMKNCVPAHEHFRCVSSIPHFVFPSWEEALAKMTEVDQIRAARNPWILYTDNIYGVNDRPRLNERRTYVREILEKSLGKRLIGQIPDRAEYLRTLASATGIVHVGGAFNGSQDRTTVEVMLLGRCLIQPEIQSLIGDARPRPGVHYVACWDDYSDLVERCQELLDRPAKAVEIRRNAREFILHSMAPEAFWNRILRCCIERC